MPYDGTADRHAACRARAFRALGVLGGYLFLSVLLGFTTPVGGAAIDLSPAAVALAGWLLGRWGGLAAGALSVPLNLAVLALIGGPWPPDVLRAVNVITAATNLLIGLAAGWTGELYRRVRAQARELARDHATLTREVAERKQAEDQLRDSEELFRLITESTADIVALFDAGRRVVYCSPAYRRTLGVDPPPDLDTLFAERFHPDDLPAATASLQRALAGSPENLTFRLRHADGSWHWLESRGTLVTWRGERYLLGVARDITGRHTDEEALRRSHEQYEALVGTVEGIVWECDLPDFRFTYVSPYAQRLLGYPVRRWLDEPDFWPAHLHPDDRDEAIRYCREATAARRDHEMVYRMIAADGRPVWLRDLVRVVVAGGRAVKLRGIMVDVTGEKATEAALRAGEELTRRILEATPAGIVRVGPDGRPRDANAHARRLLGLPDDLASGPGVADFVHRAIREDGSTCPEGECPVVQCLRTGQAQPAVPLGIRHPDGRVFWGLFSAAPTAPDPETGAPTGAVVTFVDITERKHLEDRLRQGQKLEALGRLAGGVAHDFNNLLTVILGGVEVLRAALPDGSPARPLADDVRRAGERAAALTGQLLAFGQRQIVAPQALDLSAVVSEVRDLLAGVVGEEVEVQTRLAAGLPPVSADPAQMEQVLVNLALNARDAMPAGGRLTITTTAAEAGPAGGAVPPGPYVVLEVADTGVGMEEDVRARIFDPFFTTKEVGKGAGLGLAAVYGIVRQAGGHIDVATAPGRGTAFRVYLPVARAPAPAPAPDEVPPGRGEVVLVAEDEPAVRELVGQFLRLAGYSVLQAPSALEAARLCVEHDGPIHLLLSDVVMPHLSGPSLARRAREARPGLKVLFISGHHDDVVLRHGIHEGSVAFLQKPFSYTAFARKVREVLDGP